MAFEESRSILTDSHFNFLCRWPRIFYMRFEKSYDICLGLLVEAIWKYFEKFPHFMSKHSIFKRI
jgi:hypothetical protein